MFEANENIANNGTANIDNGLNATRNAVNSTTSRKNNNETNDITNDRRQPMKSKLSPPNSNSNGQLNPPTFSKGLDEWLNNNNYRESINYQQKNMDDWLNATMKDSPKTFSVASGDFLDGPSAMNGISAPIIETNHGVPDSTNIFPFGYGNSQYFPFGNSMMHKNPPQHSSDFTSLPPGVNLNQESQRSNSQNDLLDGLDNRHFSDPCLAANSDNEDQQSNKKLNLKNSDDNTKLLSHLIQQISILHDTNSKICRNLKDTKVDIEALKHAPSWNFRHRRDSLSGFSTHSQPMGFPFGTQSPAPTYNSGVYTPGMMTDVVREVKEAARVREDALLSRVRSMVEERSWTMNETHLKMLRDMEEMKLQVNQLKSEKYEMKNQMTRLEEEVKTMRTLVAHMMNANRMNPMPPPPTVAYPNDMLFTRQNSGSTMRNSSQNRHSFGGNFNSQSNENLYANETDLKEPIYENGLDGHPINGAYGTLADGTLVQMEKDNLELRRELQDALANKKNADRKIQTLEQIVKALQVKGQANVSCVTTENGNVVTITTAHSSTRMSNNNNVNNSNSVQTLDATRHKPQLATQIQTISPKVTTNNGTSTINLTGPVTDL